MARKIEEVAKAILYVVSAIIGVLYLKWFWDIFKPRKEEKETEDVED